LSRTNWKKIVCKNKMMFQYWPQKDYPGSFKIKPGSLRNNIMKRTISILAVIFLFALGAGVQIDTVPGKAAAFETTLSCPFPSCQSTVVLSTGVPFCTGTWCGPFGSASFICDGSGNASFNCLCAGTYTWCPDCVEGIYIETVDGGPSESAADGPVKSPCPCK
jgi:hypothetical protein